MRLILKNSAEDYICLEREYSTAYLKKAKISGQCEAGYTCYTKECKSKDGPEELKRNLKGLENAPKTPQSIAADGYFKQKLEEMECSNINLNDDIGLDQERYCCRNMDSSECRTVRTPVRVRKRTIRGY